MSWRPRLYLFSALGEFSLYAAPVVTAGTSAGGLGEGQEGFGESEHLFKRSATLQPGLAEP